jgi:hypothetical protein
MARKFIMSLWCYQTLLKEMKKSRNDYWVDMITIVNAGNGDLRKDKVSVFE